MRYLKFIPGLAIFLFNAGCRSLPAPSEDQLTVRISDKPTLMEAGGPFAGIEMHGGNPQLNRISFFYPVANSIDNSADYWTRDTSRILRLGFMIGDHPLEWLSVQPMPHAINPYEIKFQNTIHDLDFSVVYKFFKVSPAFLFRTIIVNKTGMAVPVGYLTDLNMALRTCHTYRKIDRSWTSTNSSESSFFFHYEDKDAGPAVVFCINRGTKPAGFDTRREVIKKPGSSEYIWIKDDRNTSHRLISRSEPGRPGLAQIYRSTLQPGDSMIIEQVIGSCKPEEEQKFLDLIRNDSGYTGEGEAENPVIITGDSILDHSVQWAEAVIRANHHYLDGTFVPMPCPAQYNFYFTHDVLVTALSKVIFHPDQVRKDLIFIADHAKENIIPHAYYWKDGEYVTEYAGPDNWNHFWFIILSGEYLKYSGDRELAGRLFPLIETSVQETLSSLKPDSLMWAQRPDWWDIGHDFGPRAYMTILMARALESYLYICISLDRNQDDCPRTEQIINSLKEGVNTRFWDQDVNYPMNYYANGHKDPHFYTGSLLAAHFHAIAGEKITQMIKSADKYLLDRRIGVYNAFPMNFHLLYDSLGYQPDEAGRIGYYFNGGIWPQGNAWYALALISDGQRDRAISFVRDIMTVKGIMKSPNGQPAMYEYRVSDRSRPGVYGKIDKPQFLWAAGWYLYTLYHLFLTADDPWNIRFEPYCPDNQVDLQLSIDGNPVRVETSKERPYGISDPENREHFLSMVIPVEHKLADRLVVSGGSVRYPVLINVGAVLVSTEPDAGGSGMIVTLKAFKDHKDSLSLLSPEKPAQILIEGRTDPVPLHSVKDEKGYFTGIEFVHKRPTEVIHILFEE
jgi:hypothetical protein